MYQVANIFEIYRYVAKLMGVRSICGMRWMKNALQSLSCVVFNFWSSTAPCFLLLPASDGKSLQSIAFRLAMRVRSCIMKERGTKTKEKRNEWIPPKTPHILQSIQVVLFYPLIGVSLRRNRIIDIVTKRCYLNVIDVIISWNLFIGRKMIESCTMKGENVSNTAI